jgi:hypothetical protein
MLAGKSGDSMSGPMDIDSMRQATPTKPKNPVKPKQSLPARNEAETSEKAQAGNWERLCSDWRLEQAAPVTFDFGFIR